jgi:hypothetical protein
VSECTERETALGRQQTCETAPAAVRTFTPGQYNGEASSSAHENARFGTMSQLTATTGSHGGRGHCHIDPDKAHRGRGEQRPRQNRKKKKTEDMSWVHPSIATSLHNATAHKSWMLLNLSKRSCDRECSDVARSFRCSLLLFRLLLSKAVLQGEFDEHSRPRKLNAGEQERESFSVLDWRRRCSVSTHNARITFPAWQERWCCCEQAGAERIQGASRGRTQISFCHEFTAGSKVCCFLALC